MANTTHPTKLTLQNVRIAFPNLAAPKPASSDNPKLQYSAAFIIPKNHPQLKLINEIIDQVFEAKWPGKGPVTRKAAELMGKVCLKDGDVKADYEGYEGNMFINARLDATKGKPVVYGLGGKKAGPVDPSTVYSGCNVHGVISFFAYGGSNNIPKGVAAGLGDVMFIGDNDAFSAAAPRADDEGFAPVVPTDDGTDPLMG